MFLDCPAYLDDEHAVRCGLPAEVRRRFNMRSTDGLLESAMIRCPSGHWFNGPIESLTWDSKDKHDPANAAAARSAASADVTADHRGRAGRGGSAAQQFLASRGGQIPARPAPAYYLGRPAGQWITVMRPRRRRTAPDHLMQAVTTGW